MPPLPPLPPPPPPPGWFLRRPPNGTSILDRLRIPSAQRAEAAFAATATPQMRKARSLTLDRERDALLLAYRHAHPERVRNAVCERGITRLHRALHRAPQTAASSSAGDPRIADGPPIAPAHEELARRFLTAAGLAAHATLHAPSGVLLINLTARGQAASHVRGPVVDLRPFGASCGKDPTGFGPRYFSILDAQAAPGWAAGGGHGLGAPSAAAAAHNAWPEGAHADVFLLARAKGSKNPAINVRDPIVIPRIEVAPCTRMHTNRQNISSSGDLRGIICMRMLSSRHPSLVCSTLSSAQGRGRGGDFATMLFAGSANEKHGLSGPLRLWGHATATGDVSHNLGALLLPGSATNSATRSPHAELLAVGGQYIAARRRHFKVRVWARGGWTAVGMGIGQKSISKLHAPAYGALLSRAAHGARLSLCAYVCARRATGARGRYVSPPRRQPLLVADAGVLPL